MIAFRKAHPALRPSDYFEGNDHNGNGLKDITWYRDDANEPDNNYWNAPDRYFLAYRIDGSEFQDPAPSIYVAYNGWSGDQDYPARTHNRPHLVPLGRYERLDGRPGELQGRGDRGPTRRATTRSRNGRYFDTHREVSVISYVKP